MRYALLTTGRAVSLAAPYTAGDKIISQLFSETNEGLTRSEVNSYQGCEEECHVASLVCNMHAGVEFAYADVAAQIAAQAIVAENKQSCWTPPARHLSFRFPR